MEKLIKLENIEEAQSLFGRHDENIKTISDAFKVKISLRGDCLKISGLASRIKNSESFIRDLILKSAEQGVNFSASQVYHMLKRQDSQKGREAHLPAHLGVSQSNAKPIGPKTKGQTEYVEAIRQFDIVFGIGPAGTGKTYLAMACAVEALTSHKVRRIILTRPAIEAGESLGFLPGDMYEKISPYLRPLYDALYDMMEADTIEKYLETGIIEVAPLAYMRGRTLNDAFIVMDEAQNATAEQMKMFLTRIGFDSKAVITGDITQSDLPGSRPIGLLQARDILKDIQEIKFVYLTGQDVVRHPLVQKVIEAYDKSRDK